jgi:nitroreductase
METIEAIKTRRSVRGFTAENVGDETVTIILEAGRWAPSGLNNQPWRFIVVRNPEIKVELSKLTVYGHTIKNAPLLVVVFLDKEHIYNYVKDVQSIGACIQNMLLCIQFYGSWWSLAR